MISGAAAKIGLALIAFAAIAATLSVWYILSYIGLSGPVEGKAVRPDELSGFLFFGTTGIFAFMFWRLSRHILASLVYRIERWEYGE